MNILLHAWHAQQRRMDESAVSARALRGHSGGQARHSTDSFVVFCVRAFVGAPTQPTSQTHPPGWPFETSACTHTRTQSHTHHHTAHLNSTGDLVGSQRGRSCGRSVLSSSTFWEILEFPGRKGVSDSRFSTHLGRARWRGRLL
jgi:hypothetical protein